MLCVACVYEDISKCSPHWTYHLIVPGDKELELMLCVACVYEASTCSPYRTISYHLIVVCALQGGIYVFTILDVSPHRSWRQRTDAVCCVCIYRDVSIRCSPYCTYHLHFFPDDKEIMPLVVYVFQGGIYVFTILEIAATKN